MELGTLTTWLALSEALAHMHLKEGALPQPSCQSVVL